MANGILTPTTFEWLIPSSQVCRFRGGDCITSPVFHLPDSNWCLNLHFSPSGWIVIHLNRNDCGKSKTITFTIKVYCRNDVNKFTTSAAFDVMLSRMSYGAKTILIKAIPPDTDLLITCYIECNAPHLAAGKTSAVPTEDDIWLPLDRKDDVLLRERMKEFLAKANDHDVTICVQDKEFRAHRSILSARSPVFAMMFAHDTKEKNTGTITIEDCDPESFDEFLLYVYSGRTENLTPSNALRLYYPADKYDFPVLKERCVTLLKFSMSVESICDVVLLAAKHQEKELLDVAAEFLARNMKEVFVTVSWQKFLSQYPVESNELLIKSTRFIQPEH